MQAACSQRESMGVVGIIFHGTWLILCPFSSRTLIVSSGMAIVVFCLVPRTSFSPNVFIAARITFDNSASRSRFCSVYGADEGAWVGIGLEEPQIDTCHKTSMNQECQKHSPVQYP